MTWTIKAVTRDSNSDARSRDREQRLYHITDHRVEAKKRCFIRNIATVPNDQSVKMAHTPRLILSQVDAIWTQIFQKGCRDSSSMSILSALTAKKFVLELLDMIGQADCFLFIFLLNLPRSTLEEIILVYDVRVQLLLLHIDLWIINQKISNIFTHHPYKNYFLSIH